MDSATETPGPANGLSSPSEGLIKFLFARPEYGLLFLVVVVVQTVLGASLLRADSVDERYVLAGLIVAVLVLAVLALMVERKRHYAAQPPAGAVPASMTAVPIKPEEAMRATDLMTAPDGTFVYAPPPSNWKVEVTTLQEEFQRNVQQQGLEGSPLGEAVELFRSGPMVLFSELNVHKLIYLPGRSLMNGRLAFGSLNEQIGDQVRMYSVSKRGGVMRDMSAEHVFAQVLATMMQRGAKIEMIGSAPSKIGGRTTLTGLGVIKVEHVMIDGADVASATVAVRLHVVEYSNFVYVILTTLLDGVASSDARRKEIDEIVASFRAASAANAAERERADAADAEATFQGMAASIAPGILLQKVDALLDNMRTGEGSVHVSRQQLEHIQILANYAKAFPDWVPQDVQGVLNGLESSTLEAFEGRPEALAQLIHARDAAKATQRPD